MVHFFGYLMNCGFYGRYITVFVGYTQINMAWIYCNLTYYNLNIENYVFRWSVQVYKWRILNLLISY